MVRIHYEMNIPKHECLHCTFKLLFKNEYRNIYNTLSYFNAVALSNLENVFSIENQIE